MGLIDQLLSSSKKNQHQEQKQLFPTDLLLHILEFVLGAKKILTWRLKTIQDLVSLDGISGVLLRAVISEFHYDMVSFVPSERNALRLVCRQWNLALVNARCYFQGSHWKCIKRRTIEGIMSIIPPDTDHGFRQEIGVRIRYDCKAVAPSQNQTTFATILKEHQAIAKSLKKGNHDALASDKICALNIYGWDRESLEKIPLHKLPNIHKLILSHSEISEAFMNKLLQSSISSQLRYFSVRPDYNQKSLPSINLQPLFKQVIEKSKQTLQMVGVFSTTQLEELKNLVELRALTVWVSDSTITFEEVRKAILSCGRKEKMQSLKIKPLIPSRHYVYQTPGGCTGAIIEGLCDTIQTNFPNLQTLRLSATSWSEKVVSIRHPNVRMMILDNAHPEATFEDLVLQLPKCTTLRLLACSLPFVDKLLGSSKSELGKLQTIEMVSSYASNPATLMFACPLFKTATSTTNLTLFVSLEQRNVVARLLPATNSSYK